MVLKINSCPSGRGSWSRSSFRRLNETTAYPSDLKVIMLGCKTLTCWNYLNIAPTVPSPRPWFEWSADVWQVSCVGCCCSSLSSCCFDLISIRCDALPDPGSEAWTELRKTQTTQREREKNKVGAFLCCCCHVCLVSKETEFVSFTCGLMLFSLSTAGRAPRPRTHLSYPQSAAAAAAVEHCKKEACWRFLPHTLWPLCFTSSLSWYWWWSWAGGAPLLQLSCQYFCSCPLYNIYKPCLWFYESLVKSCTVTSLLRVIMVTIW